MPKRGGNRGKNGLDRLVCCPFRSVTILNAASATVAVGEFDCILSNLGARAVAIGSAFEWFRFKSLSAYAFSTYGSGTVTTAGSAREGLLTGSMALSWIDSNAALTGTPTTLIQMSQNEKFKAGNLFNRLSVRMSKSEIAAVPYKWFSTTSSGAAGDETSPGLFTFLIQTVDTVESNPPQMYIVFEGVLEFRGMITPALSFGNPDSLSKEEQVDDDVSCVSSSKSVVQISLPASLLGKAVPVVSREVLRKRI